MGKAAVDVTDNDTFGKKVHVRRKANAERIMMETGASISKSRKLSKELDKEYKNPLFCFDRECGRSLNNLISSSKRSDEPKSNALASYNLVFTGDSPVAIASTDISTVEKKEHYVRVLSKPTVCRLLQSCLKVGDEEIRLMIFDKIFPVFTLLATNSAGYHLCTKMLTYTRRLTGITEKLIEALKIDNKIFFSKYGSRIIDDACNLKGNNKLLRQFVSTIFFEKMFSSEIADHRKSPIEENIKKCSEMLRKTMKNRIQEFADKLVLKELLRSEVALKFLAIVIKQDNLLGDSELKVMAESLFEGTVSMLLVKDGVYVCSRLCGYWSAKQRKQFLYELHTAMALNGTSIRSYFCNVIDDIFIARLLLTIDDTRMAGKQILEDLFADEGKIFEENERAYKLFMAIFSPGAMTQFISPQDADLLRADHPTSKKEDSMRLSELAKYVIRLIGEFTSKNEVIKKIYEKCKALVPE